MSSVAVNSVTSAGSASWYSSAGNSSAGVVSASGSVNIKSSVEKLTSSDGGVSSSGFDMLGFPDGGDMAFSIISSRRVCRYQKVWGGRVEYPGKRKPASRIAYLPW